MDHLRLGLCRLFQCPANDGEWHKRNKWRCIKSAGSPAYKHLIRVMPLLSRLIQVWCETWMQESGARHVQYEIILYTHSLKANQDWLHLLLLILSDTFVWNQWAFVKSWHLKSKYTHIHAHTRWRTGTWNQMPDDVIQSELSVLCSFHTLSSSHFSGDRQAVSRILKQGEGFCRIFPCFTFEEGKEGGGWCVARPARTFLFTEIRKLKQFLNSDCPKPRKWKIRLKFVRNSNIAKNGQKSENAFSKLGKWKFAGSITSENKRINTKRKTMAQASVSPKYHTSVHKQTSWLLHCERVSLCGQMPQCKLRSDPTHCPESMCSQTGRDATSTYCSTKSVLIRQHKRTSTTRHSYQKAPQYSSSWNIFFAIDSLFTLTTIACMHDICLNFCAIGTQSDVLLQSLKNSHASIH